MRLPPGIGSKDFSDALREFAEAVGKEWVFSSDEDVELYRDSYSPTWNEPEEPIPSAAVAPDGVEQVQAVVRVANKYKIPLWTISTGKNLGYGASAPLLGGSVVLDLKRMNRVLEINEKNHYALLEPGVSYFYLYRYIQERKLKLWVDPPGALPGAKTWQQYKYGFGPHVMPMFSQSSLGIITKMGVWLFPQPEAFLTGTVMVWKHQDLIPLVDIFAELQDLGIIRGTITLGSAFWLGVPGPEADALRAKGSVKDLEDFAVQKNTPYWSIPLSFYGPAKVVAAQWEYAKEKFSSIPGSHV